MSMRYRGAYSSRRGVGGLPPVLVEPQAAQICHGIGSLGLVQPPDDAQPLQARRAIGEGRLAGEDAVEEVFELEMGELAAVAGLHKNLRLRLGIQARPFLPQVCMSVQFLIAE